jgi:hypothetical protein
MTLALAAGALGLALLAVGFSAVALRRTRAPWAGVPADGLSPDVLGLRQEVAALRAEGAQSLRHLTVVRYDAFSDMGGRLSWSVALLDDHGDGLVLSSIHGRSEARTYVKPIAAWSSAQQLSPEESEAVAGARAPGAS